MKKINTGVQRFGAGHTGKVRHRDDLHASADGERDLRVFLHVLWLN